MSRKIAEMYVQLDADVRGLKTGLKKAQDSIDRLGGTTEKVGRNWKTRFTPSLRGIGTSASTASGGLGRMVKSLIAVGAAYFGMRGISSLARSFLEVASSTEQFQLRLEVLLGSQEAAAEAMEFFRQTAAKVPFTLQEVIESGTTLTAMGANLKTWTPILTDLAAVMGMKLPEAASALGRAFAGGAGAADIFRERGILQIIKDSARMKSGINDITKLTLPQFREEMLKAFTDPEGKIAGAADKLSYTWQGTISMLQDKWFQFREAVMKSQVFETLKKGLAAFNEELDTLIASGKMEEWATKTAQAVLKSFRAIVKGVEGLAAAYYWLQGVVFKVGEAIIRSMLTWMKKIAVGIEVLSRAIPPLRSVVKEMAVAMKDLVIIGMEYRDLADQQFEKGADLVKVFDDIEGWLNKAIDATSKMTTETNGLVNAVDNLSGGGGGGGGLPKLKKSLGEIILGYTAWGKETIKIGDIHKSVQDNLESYVFKPLKTNIKETHSLWNEMADGLQTKWASTIGEVLRGATSLKEGLKGIWDAILVQFTDMIGQMIAKWLTDFIGKLIEGAKSAGQEIAENIGSAIGGADGGGIADAFKSVGKAAGGLLNTLSGIANIVTAVASVASLFKKGGIGSTAEWHLQEIWKNTKELRDYTFINIRQHFIDLKKIGQTIVHKIETNFKRVKTGNSILEGMAKCLRSIESHTSGMAKALSKLKYAQHGLDTMVHGPTLIMAGERGSEHVKITPDGHGGGGGINLTYAPVIQAMDSQDVYRFMSTKGKDALIAIIKGNVGGLTRVVKNETEKY